MIPRRRSGTRVASRSSSYVKEVIAGRASGTERVGDVVHGFGDTRVQPQPDKALRFTGKTHVLVGRLTFDRAATACLRGPFGACCAFHERQGMDSNQSRWQPAFRFAAWVALAYLGLVGAAIAISKVLLRVLPCRTTGGVELACPVLGVDLYKAIIYSGVAAWYGIFAMPVVVLVIAVALIIGVCGWVSAQRGRARRNPTNGKP